MKRGTRLPPDVELDLIARAQAGDGDARDRVVAANMGLAVTTARRFTGCGLDLDDLVQAASLGLVVAVGRYDRSRGSRFGTYAGHWVRNELYAALEREVALIRVPRYLHSDLIAARRGRPVAGRLYMEDALRARDVCTASGYAGESPDPAAPEPGEPPYDPWALARLRAAVPAAGLSGRERDILRLLYEAGHTMVDIGRRLGVTGESVRQAHHRALEKVRSAMWAARVRKGAGHDWAGEAAAGAARAVRAAGAAENETEITL
jgi:RNA polymerase sigma factor (sigma-70 family)